MKREIAVLAGVCILGSSLFAESAVFGWQKGLSVSHDLRTPLTLIKGYAENIAEFSWQKEERYKHDVGIIVRETDRLSNLVNDILEYSCVHGDKKQLSRVIYSFLDNAIRHSPKDKTVRLKLSKTGIPKKYRAPQRSKFR